MRRKPRISAIVLAGGHSSRMGTDKATIEIDGIALIRRIYNVLADCQERERRSLDEINIVTPWIERYQSLLPIDCNFIIEESPHQGPLMGFARGLSQIESDWVLLVACDLPNLSHLVIQTWIDRLGDIPASSMAYLPKSTGFGWEPLCGFYRHSCLDSLLEYISDGGRSFQGWLGKNVVTELTIADPSMLLNCNTPADLINVINSLAKIPYT